MSVRKVLLERFRLSGLSLKVVRVGTRGLCLLGRCCWKGLDCLV